MALGLLLCFFVVPFGGLGAQPLGGPAGELEIDVPMPSLESSEAAVRDQIEEALRAVGRARDAGVPASDLGAAYGELGQLLLAYDFAASAGPALERATTLDEASARWPYLLGSLYQLNRDLDRARAALEIALARAPADPTAKARLAEVLLAQGVPAEALGLLPGISDYQDYAAFADYVRGRAAAASDNWSGAVAAFERVLAAQPDAGVVHYHLGLAYRELNQAERAREQMALRNDREVRYPDPIAAEISGLLRGVGPSLLLARMRLAAGELDQAASYVEEALRLEPRSPQVLRSLGSIRLRQGRSDEAIVFFRDALQEEPGDVGFHFFLASLLAGRVEGVPLPEDAEARRRRLEEAAQRLGEIVRQVPGYAEAWHELAKTELDLARPDATRAALDQALAVAPDFDLARLDRATLRGYEGDIEGALADLELLATGPLREEAMLIEIRVLERAGRAEEVLARWRQLATSSESAEHRAAGLFHLANAAAAAGDEAEAEAKLREALVALPDMPEAHFNLGTLLGRTGRYAEAAAHQASVVALQPENHQARFGEAMALVLAGRFADARQRLETALELYPSVPVFAHLLARLMVAAPEAAVRDAMTGLDLAARLYQAYPTQEHAETVAMAFAEAGAFDRAVEWQAKVVEGLKDAGDGVPQSTLERATRYLELYQRREPVRSPWLDH